MLTMAPANGTETIRKALAMGAARGIHVVDDALEGADLPTTIRVLAAAAAQEEWDLLLGGLDTSDGHGRRGGGGRRRAPRPAAAVVRGGDRAGPGRRHACASAG